MRKIILLSLAAIGVIAMLTMQVCAKDQSAAWSVKRNSIVEINYGHTMDSKKVEVSYENGRTILEVLQNAAEVKTRPVGEYVIVTAIDGIEGKRGQTAWYYEVNGEPANEIAYSKIADNASVITWLYKEDVCSKTVDYKN